MKSKFERYKIDHDIDIKEKRELIAKYFSYYEENVYKNTISCNSKLDREVFSELLDDIGSLVLKFSKENTDKLEIRKFLDENPLPESIKQYLPDDFRLFSLAINALKQWISAEQLATDRFILGGSGRKLLKEIGDHCLISGESSKDSIIELHHPVRDGRFPIPLSKEVHSEIENKNKSYNDPYMKNIMEIKRKDNRSWVMLQLGCELHLNKNYPTEKSKFVKANSKSFAKKVREKTNLNYKELLIWMDSNNLF